jgi:hypothetical protein
MCWSGRGYGEFFDMDGQTPDYTISYTDFRRVAKTGDQLLYQGKGWSSCLIKAGTQSKYSHCGTVIRMRDGSLYVWESTKPDDTFDFFTLTDKDGPRLIDADEQLFGYASKNYAVTYRPIRIYDNTLRANLRTRRAQSDIWKVFRAMSKVPYEKNYLELIHPQKRFTVGGALSTFWGGSKHSIFCSELNLYTLNQGMGISLRDPVSGIVMASEDFIPKDISWEGEALPFTTPFPLSTAPERAEENKRRFPEAVNGKIHGIPEGYAVTALMGFPAIVAANGKIDPLLKQRNKTFIHTLDLYKQARYGTVSYGTVVEQRKVFGRVLSPEEEDAVHHLSKRISDLRTMLKSGPDGFSMLTPVRKEGIPDSVVVDFGKNAVVAETTPSADGEK